MTRAFTTDRRRLTALRLAAQGIADRDFASAGDVVRHLTAMQAQDFTGATWSIGLRMPNATETDIAAAIASGEIVRSWPMRGTLHFTAAEDLGWMLQLTGERTIRSAAGRHRQLGLDDAHFDLARGIAERLLSGGRVLSRTRLLESFASAGLDITENRGNHLLQWLSASGLIVFGPLEGRSQTFTLLEEWVPSPRRLDPEEALAEWVLRYFVSHGPATIRDFAWWSSLTLTDARRGLAAVESELESVEVDGVSYLHAQGLEPAASGVRVLSGFDEYLLGYQDRAPQLDAQYFNAIVPGGNGMFLSTIVVNGEIVGTWRRTISATRVGVELVPFEPIGARTTAAVSRELQRYGHFIGRRVDIS